MKVCMIVYNNFTHDSRVQKEAEELIGMGHSLDLFAVHDETVELEELRNGINIVRIQRNPWHRKFSEWAKVSWVKRYNRNKNPNGKFLNSLIAIFNKVSNYLESNDLYRTLLIILIASTTLELFKQDEFSDLVKGNTLLLQFFSAIMILLRQRIFAAFRNLALAFKTLFRKINNTIHNVVQFLSQKTFGSIYTILMNFNREFSYLSFYNKFLDVTKHNKYDIIHAHDLNTLPCAYIAARRHRAKLVYDSHELYLERNRFKPASYIWKSILKRLEHFLINRCDAVITVNESIAEELRNRYRVTLPMVLMNTPKRNDPKPETSNGNNAIRSCLGIDSTQVILLYTGAITFNRGIEKAISALPLLPNCHLVCMGPGSDSFKNSLSEVAISEGVEKRFYFFGPVPSSEVVAYSSGADIGIATIENACMSYYLCSPNKLFEYMNAGLPVIASDFPELKKVIVECDIGLTVDSSSSKLIAKVISELLKDPQRLQQMSNNALKNAHRYSWEKESRKLRELYRDITLSISTNKPRSATQISESS
jgi:glycosyltransferase involved in cell wall biosynthesis